MAERLQKILSQWGVASRRQAEVMIRAGRVSLNGTVAHLGQQADPELDEISVDGQLLRTSQRPELLYLLLHKPLGVVCTCDDPQGRRTILDLLPKYLRRSQGIHPVGRLDANSTGALLLTNDGDFTFRLTHPRHHIPKVYEVVVRGTPTKAILDRWRQGVILEGKTTRPAEVEKLWQDKNSTSLKIVLREGRNRQIRKVALQLGHPVIRLHRTAIGAIQLSNLPEGKHRIISSGERSKLQEL